MTSKWINVLWTQLNTKTRVIIHTALTWQCTTQTFMDDCRNQADMFLHIENRRSSCGALFGFQPHSDTYNITYQHFLLKYTGQNTACRLPIGAQVLTIICETSYSNFIVKISSDTTVLTWDIMKHIHHNLMICCLISKNLFSHTKQKNYVKTVQLCTQSPSNKLIKPARCQWI